MTTATPVEPDLKALAGNITLAADGLWVSPGHQDTRYLEADETDWAAIEERSFWYRHRNRVYTQLFGHFPPAGTLFEVGAGNGSVSLALQNAGHSVVSIEPNHRWAAHAKQRGVRHVICAKLEGARFVPGALSNVGIFDVLEHIPEDEAFLAGLRTLMPAGGRLYCAVPTWQCLWSREDEVAEHIRRYSPEELRRKIERAGFKVEFETSYFTALLLPILLLRALPSRLGLRRGRTSASSEAEHQVQPGLASRVLQLLLDREVSLLSAGGRKRLGASQFLVARAV